MKAVVYVGLAFMALAFAYDAMGLMVFLVVVIAGGTIGTLIWDMIDNARSHAETERMKARIRARNQTDDEENSGDYFP